MALLLRIFMLRILLPLMTETRSRYVMHSGRPQKYRVR